MALQSLRRRGEPPVFACCARNRSAAALIRCQHPIQLHVPHAQTVTRLAASAGAGKTYSLSSIQPNNIGMMPRAAAELFTHIGRDVGHMYTVTMSYVQIYMEMLQVPRKSYHCPRSLCASQASSAVLMTCLLPFLVEFRTAMRMHACSPQAL